MLTVKNYLDKVIDIDYSSLPVELQERYDYVRELTENHTTWEFYHADADITATVDQYLADLSDFLKKPDGKKGTVLATATSEQDAREVAKSLIRSYVEKGMGEEYLKKSRIGSFGDDKEMQITGAKIHVTRAKGITVDFSFPLHSIYNEVLEETGKSTTQASKPARIKPSKPQKRSRAKTQSAITPVRVNVKGAAPVERIDDAVRFIKRYAQLHGKVKTDVQILNFLNALQKAILEKRIRRTSKYAGQIEYIQTNLVKLFNSMGKEVEIKLNEPVLKEFLEIAGSEQVRLSITYMKRYVSLQGKHIDKEKAKRLHSLVSSAIRQQKINGADPYLDKIKRVLTSLKKFIDKAKPADTLKLHSTVLNGIQETLAGCCTACDKKKEQLNGLDALSVAPAQDSIMSSMDFANMKFETLGFSGKWKDFIGDPAAGFSAMISAKPKMGKSYLCADFAGYLARHHGETLFVAGEEKLGNTLQQKILSVKHPCLHVTGALPENLTSFDFIVLDSVTRLKLTPDDLRVLKATYPDKSFIYVYQVTKAGKFRGPNEAQHDVDVVIEIPEKGRAVQFGRYNQGGEMNIFDADDYRLAA